MNFLWMFGPFSSTQVPGGTAKRASPPGNSSCLSHRVRIPDLGRHLGHPTVTLPASRDLSWTGSFLCCCLRLPPRSRSGWPARFTTTCAAGPGGAGWVAAGWVVGVVVLFAVWQPLWQPFAVLLGVAGAVPRLVAPAEAEPRPRLGARAWPCCRGPCRDGDAVTIENVRNFEYRSLDDFTPRYETRTYHLANLKGVDIIFFNWGVAVDEPPRPGLRLRTRRPRLHVDRGAVPARGSGSRSSAACTGSRS